MSREELLGYVCFNNYVNKCSGHNCEDCESAINPLLDEYDRQIRAEAIDEFVKALEEHQQKNWIDNLEYGITFADIEEVAKQLEEKKC